MDTLWGHRWLRLALTAVLFYGICFAAVWSAPAIATTIVMKASFGLPVAVSFPQSPPPPLRPALFLAIIPILPFWLVAETGRWLRGKPLPLGSYLLFALVLFFAFFAGAYIDISTNRDNAMAGLGWLVASYVGAAVAASAVGGGYLVFWRRLERRRPAVVPDVF